MAAHEQDERVHEGEQEMQEIALGLENAREHQQSIREMMRPFMPMQHRDFYAGLPYLFLGYLDGEGNPWATVLSHPTRSPFHSADSSSSSSVVKDDSSDGDCRYDNEGTLFSLEQEAIHPGEHTLLQALEAAASSADQLSVGILGLDLSNRRRNRVNGILSPVADSRGRFQGRVALSFGNCPKYIQLRPWRPIDASDVAHLSAARQGPSLFESALSDTDPDRFAAFLDVVARADTFFVATAHRNVPHERGTKRSSAVPSHGVDVSHRGGPGGLVSAVVSQSSIDEHPSLELRWPDYVGNAFFNTLGNIRTLPKAGLCFPDFRTGDLWQAVGAASLNLADMSLPGAERSVSLHVERLRCLPAAFWVHFPEDPVEASPFNPDPRGDCGEPIACTLIARAAPSPDVTTFTFKLSRPRRYIPGQYAVFAIRLSPHDTPLQRAWTISSTPTRGNFGEDSFSITVKTKPNGAVSPHLERLLRVDPSALSLIGPFQGDFSVFYHPLGFRDPSLRTHLLFVAAGSGITPVISQLRLLFTRRHLLSPLQVSFCYFCRNPDDELFTDETTAIASSWSDFAYFCSFTSIQTEHQTLRGATFGRPSPFHFQSIVTPSGRHLPEQAMLCGPAGFMQSVESILSTLWPALSISKESFNF